MGSVQCCGITFGDQRGQQNHVRSVIHQKRKLFLKLLLSDLTFPQIASRIGVTHERVRQIAKSHYGVLGRDRMKSRTRFRNTSKWLDDRLIKELPRSLRIHPIFCTSKAKKRVVQINRYLCRLACYHFIDTKKHYSIKSVAGAYDFVLYFGPKGWLVFPWSERIRHSTTFGERARYSYVGGRHDYWKFLERWDLLRKRRPIKPALESGT